MDISYPVDAVNAQSMYADIMGNAGSNSSLSGVNLPFTPGDNATFQAYLTAQMSQILNNSNSDDDKNDSGIFSNNIFSNQTPNAFGGNTNNNAVYTDLIARSGLIGKTVEAVDPSDGSLFSGVVSGVSIDSKSNEILIRVGDKDVLPQYLRSVKG